MQNEKQETALAALTIALIKPELSADPRILCAAACTCKAWREAVRQCSACNTAVEVSLSAPLRLQCSFAAWLPRHAALVRSINISTPHGAPDTVDGLQWELHLRAAQQLLQQAMQLAQALPEAAAAAAAAAAGGGQNTAAAQHQLQQQACWRLPTLSSVTLDGSIGMLASLPAANLTHLNSKQVHDPLHDPAAAAALGRLSKLQLLHINVLEAEEELPHSILAGVAQLSQLTLLEVGTGCFGSKQQLQELLAQPLPLRVLRFKRRDPQRRLPRWKRRRSPPLEDLSRLTRLEELYYPSTGGGVAFPPQLQHLELHCNSDDGDSPANTTLLQPVMQLQQLRSLTMQDVAEPLPLLHRLSELPALRQLALAY